MLPCAVLFDFDGTLLDTESTVLQSWAAEYAFHGVVLDDASWQLTIGSDSDRYGMLASVVGPTFDLDACRSRRRRREAELVADLPARPGVESVLHALSAAGVQLGVVSSSPREWIQGHLRRLGHLPMFEVLVGREDAALAKPYPDLYLEALRRLRLRPADAIAVEDSANGIRAAVAAGLRCIAMPNEVTKSHDFSAAQSVVTTETLIHALALPDGRIV